MNLLNSLRTLGKGLLKGYVKDEKEVLKGLNKTIIQLRIGKSKSAGKDIPFKNLLQEAYTLYIEGVEDIVAYIKEKDKDRLSQGLFKAEEADDILANIEDLILKNKEKFEDFTLSQ